MPFCTNSRTLSALRPMPNTTTERYDGRGYPDQLKGEDIPLLSRIILIADTFDAMVSSRPYRKRLPYQVAFDELRQFAGTQFDPNIVNIFIEGGDGNL